MYAGRIVETARRDALFRQPRHPYTRRLIARDPRRRGPVRTLESGSPGAPPRPASAAAGCVFASALPTFAIDACRGAVCRPVELEPGAPRVRCFRARGRRGPAADRAGRSGGPRKSAEVVCSPCEDVDRLLRRAAQVLHDVDARRVHAAASASRSSASPARGKTTLARCIAGLHSRLRRAR